MFIFSLKLILLLYATPLPRPPPWIVNYVLYFCRSSEMFTSYSCFLSFLLTYRYVYESGGEKMQDGEFLFRENCDGVSSLTFIAVKISVTPFSLLVYLLNRLQG